MAFSNATDAAPGEGPAQADQQDFPEEYAILKRSLVAPEDEAAVIKSWADLLQALDAASKEIAERGPDIIPQIEYSELPTLTAEQKADIRRTGALVIHNVVDDEEALKWKEDLKTYFKANSPAAKGWPKGNEQLFELFYAKPQVLARTHPNVLKASTYLNAIWSPPSSPDALVSYSTPMIYADRFRIRHANGEVWERHPPHIDGGTVEWWADDTLRTCYEGILKGKWREHDPFVVDGRVLAQPHLHKRPGQPGVFRCFQGWMAMSNTGPGEGTLKVFPRVQLSNAYVVLRPFFRLKSPEADPFVADSWVFDANTATFPALLPGDKMRPTDATHPNMRPDANMTCVPRVQPGDMVFWHCDVCHSVEEGHNGPNDSSVMYIPSTPMTLQNASFLVRQRDAFVAGEVGPDFSAGHSEREFVGRGTAADVKSVEGRRAMGFEAFEIREGMSKGEKEVLREANRLIAT